MLGESSRVACGFHTLAGEMLADIAHPLEGDLLVAGDDDELIDMILGLGQEMGLRGINAGRLVHAHAPSRVARWPAEGTEMTISSPQAQASGLDMPATLSRPVASLARKAASMAFSTWREPMQISWTARIRRSFLRCPRSIPTWTSCGPP